VVAGVCFILPAFLLVWALAWGWDAYQKVPQAKQVLDSLLYGIKPVLIAIVLQALVRLARTAVRAPWLGVLTVVCTVLNAAFGYELALLFGAGAVAVLAAPRRPGQITSLALVPLAPLAAASGAAPVALLPLFLVFLKTGAVLYGSGYVLLAFLQADLVDRLHWMNEAQLLEAVAVGQVTPGPVFTTATFIGYRLAGSPGAILATVGIFLPAFVFVALSGPLVPRLRRSRRAGAFLDGVNAASLALMAVVTWRLGQAALVDALTIVLAVVSEALLLRFRINSVWLMLAGAVVGLVAPHR
jgi:chromate transporter